MKTWWILIAIGTLTASLAKRPAADRGITSTDPKTAYENYCSGCHGVQMEAFVDRQWKYGKEREDLFKSIKVGYPDGGMPAYDTTFTDPEIYALVDYIQQGIAERATYDFTEKSIAGQTYTHQDRTYRLEVITEGVDIPWGQAFLPDGDLLITNRDGGLYRLTPRGDLGEIAGAPAVHARGQGGLLDVVLHPAFAENGYVYLSYSKPGKGSSSTTAIYRGRLVGNELRDGRDIFVAEPYETTRHHYGSRMAFGPEGHLYFSVGDRGRRDKNPQALDNHAGKVHRVTDDGGIPADNPFVDRPGAMPSIFSYGHRNIQGLTREPGTDKIWTHEHGPRGGDEVNVVEAGKNYGWPVISYGINYNGTTFTDRTTAPGLEQPLHYWVPSIAPCGSDFVTGERYPDWTGDLLVGSLRFEYVNLCRIEDGRVVGEEKLLPNIGRVRNVLMGPDDFLYVATEQPGRIIRIVPETGK